MMGYVNQSGSGYLDTRLLMSWQPWEMAANEWVSRAELSPEEKTLKDTILSACREWRGENPSLDPGAHISCRMAQAFDWPLAMRQLESLADRNKLDVKKIGMDFKALKEARDHVVHSGVMPDELYGDRPQAQKLLRSAQFGVQLLVLTELGYTGMVECEKDGFRDCRSISEFLLPQTPASFEPIRQA